MSKAKQTTKAEAEQGKVIDLSNIPGAPTDLVTTTDAMTLSRAEIDVQIATAKQYPRSIADYEKLSLECVRRHLELSKDPKDGLYYSMSRKTKGGGATLIEGPNVRLAEIIAHSWRNNLSAARPVGEDETGKFIMAEGVFKDLETNTSVRMYTKRRIVDSEGHKYRDDMIGVTENAASAIAFRNAVLKGIPKLFWWPRYLDARKITAGEKRSDFKDKLEKALATCRKFKVTDELLCAALSVRKVTEITPDKLATLIGFFTAIKNHEATWQGIFGVRGEARSAVRSTPAADNAERLIDLNQQRDVYTFMNDNKLYGGDLAKAFSRIGHMGELKSLPHSKLKALIEELGKMRRQ